MSDALKHECGIAQIRLLKPLEFYKEKCMNLDGIKSDLTARIGGLQRELHRAKKMNQKLSARLEELGELDQVSEASSSSDREQAVSSEPASGQQAPKQTASKPKNSQKQSPTTQKPTTKSPNQPESPKIQAD